MEVIIRPLDIEDASDLMKSELWKELEKILLQFAVKGLQVQRII